MKRENSMNQIAPMSVLLVEDSVPVRQRLRSLMAETQSLHLIAEAATVAEATNLFDTTHPQGVVLDIGLPDGSGIDVLRHVRERNSQCVVIVLSNYLEPETYNRCSELGADFLFSKSDEFEQAIETLRVLSGQTGSTAQGNRQNGVSLSESEAKLSACALVDQEESGLRMDKSSGVATGLEVARNRLQGIYETGSRLDIADSSAHDNLQNGVLLENALKYAGGGRVAVTVTPGSAPPVSSMTRPVMEAAPVWARARDGSRTSRNTQGAIVRHLRAAGMTDPPGMTPAGTCSARTAVSTPETMSTPKPRTGRRRRTS
jgi:DNA-binding NarL/FixJ family response regulator